MKNNLFFDLDGTIINSSEGIYASIQYAMEKLELEKLDQEVLRSFVGPPLIESFRKLGLGDLRAQQAVVFYREHYAVQGMYQIKLYDQMEQVLRQLAVDKKLFIATSKPEVFAKKILGYLKLDDYFTGIYGADLENIRVKKQDVLKYAIESSGEKQKSSMLMIGDRKHDMAGAEYNALDSLGVLYGFGDQKELLAAGANKIAAAPVELPKLINEW